MTDRQSAPSDSHHALSQKALAARRVREARTMSPEKAMRRALSRTADVLWDLVLVTKDVVCDTCDQTGVESSFREDELLVLLDGPDGAIGFVSIAREVMTSVIEVQTIGQVTKMAVPDRVLTHTDAAMVAPLIEGSLERLVQNLEDNPTSETVSGFRFGAMIEDPRAAALLLEAPSYMTFHAEVDLALGRRRGSILFTFPVVEHKATQHGSTSVDGQKGPFEEALMLVDTDLDTVLGSITLPLSKLRTLSVGDQLGLNLNCHTRVALRSQEGRVIAGGVLGQSNGKRAVRLTWPTVNAETLDPAPVVADGSDFAMTDGLDDMQSDLQGDAIDLTAVDTDLGGDLPSLPELPSLEFDGGDFGGGDVGLDLGGGDADDTPDFDMGDFDFSPEGDDQTAETGEAATSLDDFDFTSDFSMPDLSDDENA